MPVITFGTGRLLISNVSFIDIIRANATYAWMGGTLPESGSIASWTDMVGGVVASAGGTAPTVDALNGRRAALFGGAGYVRTAAFGAAIAQPHASVSVVAFTTTTAGGSYRPVFDGIAAGSRHMPYINGSNQIALNAGLDLGTSTLFTQNAAQTWRTIANGAASEIYVNGTFIAGGNAGTNGISGITIGNRISPGAGWIGKIALIAIVSGINYAARALAIEAAAMSFYNV